MTHSSRWLALGIALATLAGCGRSIVVQVPVAIDSSELTAEKGTRVRVPELKPVVMVKGTPPSREQGYRVAVFSSSPTRHGAVDPATFALENAVMWSGRVPVAPAVGVLDGRNKLSDIERIIRTQDANKVDLILQMDEPRLNTEPMVPCAGDRMCLPSMMQVEGLKKLNCTPVGSLPGLRVISVEARVVRVEDARVLAMARGAIVAPDHRQVRRFEEPSVPNSCRFETFAVPDPYEDFYDCCRAVILDSKGKLKAEDVCPQLLECRTWGASEAFKQRAKIEQENSTVKACSVTYTAEQVARDEKVPRSLGEALWLLQQSVVHSLLGGPKAPNALPPTVTQLPSTLSTSSNTTSTDGPAKKPSPAASDIPPAPDDTKARGKGTRKKDAQKPAGTEGKRGK